MRNQIDLLATVTVLGVLEQAYFALQVIYARRKYKISPPETTGHPEFERIFRAQANCSEYFPIFISLLWVAGIFFHQSWGRCTPVPGCSGCCWGWRWPGSWHISCCPTPPHGRQRWHGPASCSAPGERGRGSPKTTTRPQRRGGTRVAWSVTEYLPSSLLTFEGRWTLALLCLRSSALQR
ncbi:leukotriene C4 synthase isoform 1-T1 [Theristicus caerulescens]